MQPPASAPPILWVPSPRNTPTQIVQTVFPLTPGQASTPAQIAQALIVSGTGLARVDVFVSALANATIASAPVLAIPGIGGSVIVPVSWTQSKNTSAPGALATIYSLQYASALFNGFTSMTTIGGDTNNARRGMNIGVGSVGLNVLDTTVRDPTGLGIEIIGSADPGNFPASQTPVRFSIIFYSYVPQP